MSLIRDHIEEYLLEPLKLYPTVIQDTILELAIEKLEELYNYMVEFPEIVSANQSRLDIVDAIASQFLYTIQDNADLQEQIDILNNVLTVYNKRGSIDTIENMWKYYGGELPKEVEVIIPSYNLFRYSISALSGRHVFADGTTNRTGVYEVRLTNNTYPIPELREFMISELVAAGNYIYFTNTIASDILSENEYSNPYKYLVEKDTLVSTQLEVLSSYQGLTYSGLNKLSSEGLSPVWSGDPNIYIDLTYDISDYIDYNTYIADLRGFDITLSTSTNVLYTIKTLIDKRLYIESEVYCTPESQEYYISRNLYNVSGELLPIGNPKIFTLGKSNLGEFYYG